MSKLIFSNKKLSNILKETKAVIKKRSEEDSRIEESIKLEIASEYILKIAAELKRESNDVHGTINAGGSVSFLFQDFSVLIPSPDIKRGLDKVDSELSGIMCSETVPVVESNNSETKTRVRKRVVRLSERESIDLVGRIKKYREIANVSQQELANSIGISQPELSAFERGVTLIPASLREAFEEKISS
jgi:DNA-binding XRE family transcriptional regulator